jgi:dTDP-4-dehydrorhamnose 3,5-epimerase
MTFNPCPIPDLWKIDLSPRPDERGWLVRTFCEESFAGHGLNTRWPQASSTRTLSQGTIRGMHWQAHPAAEAKLLRCVRGAIWDVVVDLRPRSPSFGQWLAFNLSESIPSQLYIPHGCAHGFQSTTDDVELSYLMSAPYDPALARGFRWDDPALAIPWPLPPVLVSPRDRSLPLLAEALAEPMGPVPWNDCAADSFARRGVIKA